MEILRFKRTRENGTAPTRATAGSAGYDLTACGETLIQPGERALVETGISIAVPAGYEGQVRPRSGLALKRGVTVLNSPGTIDSDYRGEVGVILVNHGAEPAFIRPGDRIAQLVLCAVATPDVHEVDDLGATDRGGGGFGSTG